MVGNFTTIKLPQKMSSGDIPPIRKRCVKALRQSDLRLDGSALASIEFPGEFFFASLANAARASGHRLVLGDFSPALRDRLSRIESGEIPARETPPRESFPERIGELGFLFLEGARTFLYLLSECLYWSLFKKFDRNGLPFDGTAKQMLRLGSEAAGIVFLLVFLIAFTLALQSANMLNAFGAASYLSVGMGFLMFAEIGPLLTAIILAGRSGSSITAEIASMTVAEEVKALKTMGIGVIQYLILPRFKAMCIAVPLLSFCSAVLGCVAGLVVADLFCDVSPANYWIALKNGIPPLLLVKSLFKSLVFGWIITLVACQKGLNVRGGADAVGRATTSCVVTAIAGIILADALFSFLFY